MLEKGLVLVRFEQIHLLNQPRRALLRMFFETTNKLVPAHKFGLGYLL